jgi:hypothetical protein
LPQPRSGAADGDDCRDLMLAGERSSGDRASIIHA